MHELADLHWRKRRLRLGQILPFYKERTPAELTRAAKHGPKKLIGYLAQQSPSALNKKSEFAKALIERMRLGDDPHQKDGHDFERPRRLPGPTIDNELVARAYEPERLEQILRVEAMIDARITKVMVRLASYKEFKNIHGMKSLPCPSDDGRIENTPHNHCENK